MATEEKVTKQDSATTAGLRAALQNAQSNLSGYQAPQANQAGNNSSNGGLYSPGQLQNGQAQLQSYQDAVRQAQEQLNNQISMEAQGRNGDGSYIRPEWESNLDPATGLLKDQYVVGKDFNGEAINTQGLDQFRTEALRAQGTDSLWAQLQKAQTAMKAQKDMDTMSATQNVGLAGQFDNMGATGGVSTGSRERMASNSLRDMIRGRQDVRNTANNANLTTSIQDETNRQSNLKALPGMEIADGQYRLQNDQAKFQVQQYNVNNALTERTAKRNDDMSAWTKNQEVWAANKQADAQQKSGGGGGCCFIFLEARYGNGTMDSVVRRFRDENMTERNKRGYYKLSEVLVPLMRKSRVVKALVQVTMTSPLTAYGKYHYGQGKLGVIFTPVKNFWLKAFDYLGQDHKFIRENGETL